MYKYFLFLSILVFLLVVKFHLNIFNLLGEKLFLGLHLNTLAIYTLELPNTKNDRTYYLLGRIYFVENKLEKSVDNYTKAIFLKPNIKEYYYGRGLAYGFAGENFYDSAIKDFQSYIYIDEKEKQETGKNAWGAWAAHNDLAWIYFMKGDFQKAEEAAREGLKISNINPWLLNSLGASLLEQGECQESLVALENAKVLMKSITEKQFGEAYSGDSPDFWEIGKKQMEKSIEDNMMLCKKTFPQ